MLTAIVYTSNTGYTKQYAEMLSKATGLPAYNLANSIPPAARGTDVIFMGWLMAGGVQGYKKANKLFRVRALCAVGMSPAEPDQTAGIRKRYGCDDLPMFYLQGGFDINKLTGIYKLMMKMMCKKILGDLAKVTERTPEQEAVYQMATVGLDCVSEANLQPVLAWYETEK